MKRSEPSLEAGKIENAPLGKFVSAKIPPISIAPKGVLEAGFITKGHPAAIAGAILCAARFNGKLKGEINEHGPIGTLFHIPLYPLALSLMSRG